MTKLPTVTRQCGSPVSISARYEAIVAVNGEFEIKEVRKMTRASFASQEIQGAPAVVQRVRSG